MESALRTASYILFFLLLAIEVIYYGFGAAIQNLNISQVRENADIQNDKKSKYILQIADKPDKYVNTVQLLVTCIQLVLGGYFLGFLDQQFIQKLTVVLGFQHYLLNIINLFLSGFILLLLILVFGIIIPKKIAMQNPIKWVNTFIIPIRIVNKLLTPITWFVNFLASLILKIFGIKNLEDETDVTEEEILSMVNEGHEQGVLRSSEAEMISNIFEFSDKEARDIMTHRTHMNCIDGSITLKEAVNFMLTNANSRYPVYIDNLDHIMGIVHLKDACRALENGEDNGKGIRTMKNLIRDAIFIPETRKIDILFKNMQSIKAPVVIVIDEYGQTEGLITMEDILEEIVGNIFDEYDNEEDYIEQKGENQYEIDGLMPLEELGDLLQIDFSNVEFETLNGLMISHLERIPDENDIFDLDYGGYNFKVLHVENKIIKSVLVTKIIDKN